MHGYYYVQGVHTWQAQCINAAAGTITAAVDWGDNLEGTALKSGTPIRVEVGLTDATAIDDRLPRDQAAAEPVRQAVGLRHGSRRSSTGGGHPDYLPVYVYDDQRGDRVEEEVTDYVRVYDIGARFSLYNKTTGTYVVEPNTVMTAEINATGKVVYGYNWGTSGKGVKVLPTAGDYILTFYAPNVTLAGAADGHTLTLDFTVAAKNNGGGKKK